MQRGLGGTAFEAAEQRPDKELTMGPTMLIALAIGLLTLCSFCFVMGYAVGHRGAPGIQAVSAPSAPGTSAAKLFSSQPKPSATPLAPSGAANSEPGPPPENDPETQRPAASAAAASVLTQVQPALPVHPLTAQPLSGSAARVAPALSQGQSWMVQIAAVSHPEDADVLVGALRRRGYAVSARREPADGLLHVQVGPFGDRNEALGMRQRLLSDGYNAIIQP